MREKLNKRALATAMRLNIADRYLVFRSIPYKEPNESTRRFRMRMAVRRTLREKRDLLMVLPDSPNFAVIGLND